MHLPLHMYVHAQESAKSHRREAAPMATPTKLTVRVSSSRSASVVKVSTAGQYMSTSMNTITIDATGQPIFTTSSPKAFWTAVLAAVQAEIAALP